MTEKEKIEMIFRALSLGFNVERTKEDGSVYFVNEPVVSGEERSRLVAELTALLTNPQEVTA